MRALYLLKGKLRSSKEFYRRFRLMRNRFYIWKYGLKNVHPTTYVCGRSKVSTDLVAREYCFIGGNCLIGSEVQLGRYVMISANVAFVGDDHRFDEPGVPMIFSGRPKLRPTILESDVWIGRGVTIMAGVRIGRGAIVAAGAIVTKGIPAYEIWGGVPARKIGERFASVEDRQLHDRILTAPAHEGEYAETR